MPSIADLWLPIVVAAVLVHAVSALMHMVLPHHKNDYQAAPDEAALLAAIRAQGLRSGNYHSPHVSSGAEARSEAMQLRMKTEPTVLLHVAAPGSFNMGRTIAIWFVYCLAASVLVAYIASHTLAIGASYPAVFRVAGFAGFLVFAAGQPIESIWFLRSWSSTIKNVIDGLIYGLVVGGTFGWLWPRVAGG